MAIPQQKFREIVFQLLYSKDIAQSSEEETTLLIMKELSVTKKSVKKAQEKVDQVFAHLPEIDTLIAKTSCSYSFERIQSIERNVLRLGVYELLFDDSIPPKVAISEAMRISKKFGTPESATFINALLDTIYKKSLGEESDTTILAETAEQLKKSEQFTSEITLENIDKEQTGKSEA